MAWALNRHPDRFDFRRFEAEDRLGGNAITADIPQDDGTSIPFGISVTACIPSVCHHIVPFMAQHGIEPVDTRLSYRVHDQPPRAKGSDQPCLVTCNYGRMMHGGRLRKA